MSGWSTLCRSWMVACKVEHYSSVFSSLTTYMFINKERGDSPSSGATQEADLEGNPHMPFLARIIQSAPNKETSVDV